MRIDRRAAVATSFLFATGCTEQPGPDPFVEVAEDALVLEVQEDGSVRRGAETIPLSRLMAELAADAKKRPRCQVHLRLHPDLITENLQRVLLLVRRVEPPFPRVTCAAIERGGKPERALEVFGLVRERPAGTTVFTAELSFARPALRWEAVRSELTATRVQGRTDLILIADNSTTVRTLLRVAELAKRCGFDDLELKRAPSSSKRPARAPGFRIEEIVEEVVPEEEVLETEITETEEVFENIIDEPGSEKIESAFQNSERRRKSKAP